MTNHAPAPWMVGNGRDRGQIIDAEGERVCRLTNDPTSVANARLIAAAPELLASLKNIISGRPAMAQLSQGLLEQASRAIHSAEGRP